MTDTSTEPLVAVSEADIEIAGRHFDFADEYMKCRPIEGPNHLARALARFEASLSSPHASPTMERVMRAAVISSTEEVAALSSPHAGLREALFEELACAAHRLALATAVDQNPFVQGWSSEVFSALKRLRYEESDPKPFHVPTAGLVLIDRAELEKLRAQAALASPQPPQDDFMRETVRSVSADIALFAACCAVSEQHDPNWTGIKAKAEEWVFDLRAALTSQGGE